MFKIGSSFVRKCAVVVIDVKDIIRQKIVGYENIFQAIKIKIGDAGAVTIPFNRNSRLHRNVREESMTHRWFPIVAVQATGTGPGTIGDPLTVRGRMSAFHDLINGNVYVKVSIIVVVKK